MLTTDTRFTFLDDAATDSTGVTRARTCGVTSPAYLALATIAPTANPITAAITANVWSESGRKAMTQVDFHDRWPLYSTS